jgi:MFS family permease
MGWGAMRYRPFQIFFGGMFAANTGGFVYVAALGWYVLQLTGSPAAVGLAYAANGLPQLLLTVHAGLFTDRYGARPMVAIGIGAAGILMIVEGLVTLIPNAPFDLILLAAAGCGAAYAVGGPGSMSIVSELVPPEAMSSSMALNWLQLNIARIAGGLLGGLLLAMTSPALAFAVAGILNAAPALAILTLKVRPDSASRLVGPSSMLRPIVEAFRYAWRYPTLGVIVLLAAAPGAIGLSYIFLLSTAASELGIGANGLGKLIAASGVGGLIAGVALESIQRRFGHGRTLFFGLGLASVALIVFGFAPNALVAIVTLPFVGAGFVTYAAATATLIQAMSPARLRGRMVGLFATLYWGLLPVGGIVGGAIAQVTSGRTAIMTMGFLMAACAAVTLVARRQIVTLQVRADGLSLTGDLDGTGVEPEPTAGPATAAEGPESAPAGAAPAVPVVPTAPAPPPAPAPIRG